ncbi:MAG: glycosyltransferase [Proteiniphilum sp.]|uniref:glycosyltransferase family 2 protein n=1 Tax=Proteiniphilum sp. TaxID=1926877 RepID=UPI002ABC4449|nr:glycosyltransferase [Proteiniphilum sp.]MDY9918636.1 glycosyltransferase [Proteiniphilum sp.]
MGIDRPLVSIIMPSYNSGKFISNSIQSIINQTYTNWELLITDDCSMDDTISVISIFSEKDSRIKLYQLEQNSGPGVARNNSIEKASGRFIAFCDSDDKWTPDKLEKQIDFMLNNQVYLSYTNYEIVNENDQSIAIFIAPNKITYKDMLKNDDIGCLTAIYDTTKLGKVFMPSIRKRQDWVLWINILKKIPYALGLNETLAIYKKREQSISSNKAKLIKYIWAVYRKEEKMSIINSLLYTLGYFFHYWKKVKIRIKKT